MHARVADQRTFGVRSRGVSGNFRSDEYASIPDNGVRLVAWSDYVNQDAICLNETIYADCWILAIAVYALSVAKTSTSRVKAVHRLVPDDREQYRSESA